MECVRRQELSGKGLGVNQEGYLIQQDLYDHGSHTHKYIPVLLDRSLGGSVPGALRGFMSYELPDDYEQLYRRLTRQPAVVRAPLGKLRAS